MLSFTPPIFASHILSAEEKEKLVEICSEYRLRNIFKGRPLINVWMNLNKVPIAGVKAVAVSLPFSTAYLCEK
jgi:hypothetical protein